MVCTLGTCLLVLKRLDFGTGRTGGTFLLFCAWLWYSCSCSTHLLFRGHHILVILPLDYNNTACARLVSLNGWKYHAVTCKPARMFLLVCLPLDVFIVCEPKLRQTLSLIFCARNITIIMVLLYLHRWLERAILMLSTKRAYVRINCLIFFVWRFCWS